MKAGFRQSMSWLHTWVGLLVGWILFAVFLSGTLAYFNYEISSWMQPEVSQSRDQTQAAAQAGVWLQKNKPDASEWTIIPAPERGGATRVLWTPAAGPDGVKPKRDPEVDTAWLDPTTGERANVRRTQGGAFFYRLHFDIHYMPAIWGRWIVGVCAMLMFIAILTGIVVHRKIFADFFMLRFGKGQRSWLDAHNVAGVLALPFHIMITFTGFVTLASLYMPWGIAANYKLDDDYFKAAFPQAEIPDARGVPAPPFDMTQALSIATTRWEGGSPSSITVSNPADENAVVRMFRSQSDQMNGRAQSLMVNRAGEVMWASPEALPAVNVFSVMIGLHAGRYSGSGLRWLYFLSGLGGTAMIATGLVLWTAKRSRKAAERPHFGMRLVETLNIGTIVGFPLAVATYFLANRLLPLDVPIRAEAEINCFFAVWGLSYVYATIRPARRAWIEMLTVGAAAFFAVPVISAVTTERSIVANLFNGDWTRLGFDFVTLIAAAGFAFAARKAASASVSTKTPKHAKTPAEVSA